MFKEKNTRHVNQLIFEFLSQVNRFALEGISNIKSEFDTIAEKLQRVPNTPEELSTMKKYLEHVHATTKDRNKLISIANERFSFLEGFQFDVTDEEFQFRYNNCGCHRKRI